MYNFLKYFTSEEGFKRLSSLEMVKDYLKAEETKSRVFVFVSNNNRMKLPKSKRDDGELLWFLVGSFLMIKKKFRFGR